jgi:hypothetical protein
MIQTTSPDESKQGLQTVEGVQPPAKTLRTWPVVVSGLGLVAAGAGGAIALIHFSAAIADIAARYGFIAQNVLSLCIFLAVVAQALIYFSQRNLMKEQWLAMREASTAATNAAEMAKGQLVAMQSQERAMWKASEHAEQALRISQRAYVGVKMNPTIEWHENGYPIVTLYFTNAGHTPAKRCELCFEYGFNPSATVFQDYRKGFTIAAHIDKSIDCECPNVTFRPDYSEAFFYFRGQLRYVDAWEGTQATPFHYFYNPKALGLEEFYMRNPHHAPPS